MKDQIEPERKDEQSKQDFKTPTKMNTVDMATKLLPAKAITIFSKMVLGLQDAVYYSFSIDWYHLSHNCPLLFALRAFTNLQLGGMSDIILDII